jgi:hypothetical protein
MTELEQIIAGLKKLGNLGLPIESKGKFVYSECFRVGTEEHLINSALSEVRQDAIASVIEREVEGRRNWLEYFDKLNALVGDTLINGEYWLIKRRPTLLEVINAAVEVLQ